MNRSSRSVYTVTRSTYLPGDDEMSDIAYIDVDEDDDYIDSGLSSTLSAVKPSQGSLYEAKCQVSDHQRDLSERGVFDYFSSPLTLSCNSTNRAPEPNFRPQNHYYLGPGGSASLRSSGARRFVEAHRQADTTTSSDEEGRGSTYESRWSPSSHKDNVDDSPSLDSQWVKQQYNQHVRQANTQCYDEAMLCDDQDNYCTENRSLSPVSSTQASAVDFISSRSIQRDNEHVLSRHTCSDMSHDVCDSFECLKLVKDTDLHTDGDTLHGESANTNCGADQSSSLSATQSYLLRSSGRNSKDICDTVLHRLSSSGQSWPISARSCDSYGGTAAGSHQTAVCRSESSTVVSAVGSVRCSTGVDTGVGFPLSTVSSRNSQAHLDGSRLSSSGQSTVTSGLDKVHWATSNGLQTIADYRKNYDGAVPRSYFGRSSRYEQLTLRKNSEDADSYPYGSRGDESDGDDYGRRHDADVTSNADILQHRIKDYDSSSSSTSRPFVSTPQYHLLPTEEEETERRQSAKGQQLERMLRRRNARLNRQSAGFSSADKVPGFRGEESLENLISYIDAPVQTARKSKKKKKKVSTADGSDAGAAKLANSCEVFVGTSAISSDEPSVRVGDSCCIELRKKADCDSFPDYANTPVNAVISAPDIEACSNLDNKGIIVTSTTVDIAPDAIVSLNASTDVDTSHSNMKLAEDLPEVVYAEVKNAVLEDENIPANVTESFTATVAGDEALAVTCETYSGFPECNGNGNQTATDVNLTCVETGNVTNMTDSVCSLTAENGAENAAEALAAVNDGQHELCNILPLLTGSDSITSDTGSVDDLFVTVQKKKRSKNTAVISEEQRQRFGRRSSTKGAEDRDISHNTKRSWVKSSETTSIVPLVSVSHSSIIYCKPSCPVTQRNNSRGLLAARYSQASNTDTVLSSSAAGRSMDKLALSALLVKTRPEDVAEQSSKSEPEVTDSACASSRNNANEVMHRSDENEKNASESDSATLFNCTSAFGSVVTTHCEANSPAILISENSKKTCSDMPVGMGSNEISHAVSQKSEDDLSPADKLDECASIQIDGMASNWDVSSEAGEDQSVGVLSNEGKLKSSQLSVQIVSSPNVFLDTRNIAGTTPPRSDISFGFDPGSSPESLDVTVSQQVSPPPPTGTFTAVAASCHCPVVAPLPPTVAGCAPLLYFYPAMPVTILPPVPTYTTGRCTPIGVVPPMPAVADVSNVSVAPPAWQSTDDKLVSVPVQQVEQSLAVDDEKVATAETSLSTLNKATNEFVLYAAQRYLYSEFEKVLEASQTSLPHECLVVHYSSLEALQQH